MIKAIESELYKISKTENYDEDNETTAQELIDKLSKY